MTGPRLIPTAKLAAEFGISAASLTRWSKKFPALAKCHDGRGFWYVVAARRELRAIMSRGAK